MSADKAGSDFIKVLNSWITCRGSPPNYMQEVSMHGQRRVQQILKPPDRKHSRLLKILGIQPILIPNVFADQ